MDHMPGCRQRVDLFGQRWHSAICESPSANYIYALQFSGGDDRYAKTIVAWIFGGSA